MDYDQRIIQDNASSTNARSRNAPTIPEGLLVTPSELFFGALVVGDDQLLRTFNVKNIGKKTIRIDSVTLTTETTFVLEGAYPNLLRPNEEFEMSVRYTSDSLGLKVGVVEIETNETKPPYTVGLSGRVIGSTFIEAMYDDLYAMISEEMIVRANADEAEAIYRLIMRAEIEDGYAAAIEVERIARVNALGAEATNRELLEASLRDEITSSVLEERTARVNALEAEATARLLLKTEVDGEFFNVAASISSEALTRSNEDEALSLRIDTLSANYLDIDDVTGIANSVASALITVEQQARADEDEALASRIETIEVSYQTSGDVAATVNAAITVERTAWVDADEALSIRIEELTAGAVTIGDIETAVDAAVSSEASARTSAIAAEAARVDSLLTSYVTTPVMNGAISTAVSAEAVNRTNAISSAISAEVSRVDGIFANYTTTSGMNSAIGSAISSEVSSRDSAIASAVAAEAFRIDSVLANYTTTSGMNGAITAAVNAEVTSRNSAIASAVGAEASRIDSVLASYTTTSGMNSSIASAISAEVSNRNSAIASAVGAQASLITAAQVRADNSYALAEIAQYAAVDAQGKLSSRLVFQSITGENRASLTIHSDNGGAGIDLGGDVNFRGKLRVNNGIGGPRVEITDTHIIIDNGTTMEVFGLGFGAGNQFSQWSGPSMPLSSCNEGNGITWKKLNGSAYFGGALNAGVISNAQRTTDLGTTPGVVVGPFGSNGNQRVITASWSRTYEALDFYDGPYWNGVNPSGTLRLFRGSNAGGSLLNSQSFTGSVNVLPSGGGDPGFLKYQVSGSFSFTDNTGGIGPHSFYADITGMVLPNWSGSANGPFPLLQNVSVISVEQ